MAKMGGGGGNDPKNKIDGSKNSALDSSLLESATLESTPKIIIENCFISDTKTDKNFDIFTQNGTAHITSSEKQDNYGTNFTTQTQSSKIDFKSLDSIVKTHNFSPNFIKIDTDGFDFCVLRSAFKTLERLRPSVIFEWDFFFLSQNGEDALSIFRALKNIGYKELIILDNFGYVLSCLDISDTRNLELLLNYTKIDFPHGKNIYYYDVLVLGDGIKSEEMLRELAL